MDELPNIQSKEQFWSQSALGGALGLISLLATSFGLGQLYLMAGGHLQPVASTVILAVAAVLSLLVAWRAGSPWSVAIVAALTVCASLLSGALFDGSWDGQEYHYVAVYALAHGWNPYFKPGHDLWPTGAPWDLWAAHYPIGAWTSSALQVSAGLSFEASKDQNLLAWAALFLAAFSALTRFSMKPLTALLIAGLAALNPVIVVQLFTRMNDGLLGACLALAGLFAILWIIQPRWWAGFGVACALIVGINLKFSGLPLAVCLCGFLCLLALWLKGWATAWRAAAGLAAIGGVAVILFGAHPYLTNTLRHGHPFYPLMGEGKVDIMTSNRPLAFRTMSPAQRLAASYFGATASGANPPTEHRKLPLMIYKSELKTAGAYDIRIGGFGPWSSAAFVLSLALAIALLIGKPYAPSTPPLLCAAAAVLAVSLAMPEAWWARYVPQLWWCPVLVLTALLLTPSKALHRAGWALAVILTVNVALVTLSSVYQELRDTIEVRQQNQEIAKAHGKVCLYPDYAQSRVAMLAPLGEKIRVMTTPPSNCVLTPLAGALRGGYCLCP